MHQGPQAPSTGPLSTPQGAPSALPAALDGVLTLAELAFEAGDWREARSQARRALAAAEHEGHAEGVSRARELLGRFGPDPQLVALLVGALAAFVAVCLVWLRR